MSSPLRRALAAGTLALATATATLTLAPTAAQAVVLPNNFKSVGYMPSWAGNINTIQYGKLTHINYAFILPNGDGSLQGVDGGRLSSLVSQGHANNVKVSIAVGGWNDGNDSAFEALAGNAGSRTNFVNNLVNFVNQYNLDGVDMDWEYPDPGTSANNYTALMTQLSSALHSRGKLLTAAVVSEGGTMQGVQTAVFAQVDWLNIMAYDGGNPHSNYDWSINSVNLWKARACRPARRCSASRSTAAPSTTTTRTWSGWTRQTPTGTVPMSAGRSSAGTAFRRSSARRSGR
ncbi:hypothetical protein GCM10027614_07970 [Micromonospora vulcania]